MTSTKYIGMDVHKESISIAVMNSVGKVVVECVIDTPELCLYVAIGMWIIVILPPDSAHNG